MYRERGALYGTGEGPIRAKARAHRRARGARCGGAPRGFVATTAGSATRSRPRTGRATRTRVIPNGCDVPRGPRVPRPGRRGAPPRILYAGQLYPWKGVDVLVEAMARGAGRAARDPGRARGRGGRRRASRALVRAARASADRTEMPGTVPPARVADELRAGRGGGRAVPAHGDDASATPRRSRRSRPWPRAARSSPPTCRAAASSCAHGENALLVPPGRRRRRWRRRCAGCSRTRRSPSGSPAARLGRRPRATPGTRAATSLGDLFDEVRVTGARGRRWLVVALRAHAAARHRRRSAGADEIEYFSYLRSLVVRPRPRLRRTSTATSTSATRRGSRASRRRSSTAASPPPAGPSTSRPLGLRAPVVAVLPAGARRRGRRRAAWGRACPPTGSRWPYAAAACYASALYGFLGLLLVHDALVALRRVRPRRRDRWRWRALWLGTPRPLLHDAGARLLARRARCSRCRSLLWLWLRARSRPARAPLGDWALVGAGGRPRPGSCASRTLLFLRRARRRLAWQTRSRRARPRAWLARRLL